MKISEIGKIPENWRVLQTEDIKSTEKKAIISGPFGSNISAKFFVDSGVPVIRGNNLSLSVGERFKDSGFVYITEEKANSLNTWASLNDIVFTAVGTIGQVGIIEQNQNYENYIISNKQLRLTVNDKLLIPLFAYYWYSSKKMVKYIKQRNTGSSVPLINLTVLKSLPVPIPPLPEQKAIAEVLSSLDDKIDLLHRQNQTLEQMAQTLFRQWFVVEADEDWEEGTLDDAIELFDRLRIPLSKMERNNRKDGKLYPYYGAASVMDYINDFIFDGEYILLGEDGTVKTSEGYPVLQYATGKFWVNNHAHILKAKEPYNNFFIWNYLLKKDITNIITGAVQPKINQGNLKSLDFPKYPINLVNKYKNITLPIYLKTKQNTSKIQTLEKLRDILLPKLMSGEIRVNS